MKTFPASSHPNDKKDIHHGKMTIIARDAVSRNRGSESSLYSNQSDDRSSLKDKINEGVTRLRNSGIDETTIPDAFANAPKVLFRQEFMHGLMWQ